MKKLCFFLNCQNKLPQQAVKAYTKLKMESAILLNYWCSTLSIQEVFFKCRNTDVLHKNN